jgi:hypothetical protein
MGVPFPAIKPVSRTFTPAEYQVSSSEAQNGVVSFREWGDKPSKALLDLGFDNKLDAVTASLLRVYRESRAGFIAGGLILPPEIFSGDGPELDTVRDDDIEGLIWRFASRPPFRSVYNRIHTIPVQLIGELRMD